MLKGAGRDLLLGVESAETAVCNHVYKQHHALTSKRMVIEDVDLSCSVYHLTLKKKEWLYNF